MRILIDTIKKEISLESDENLKEVLDFMQKNFSDEWMIFTIKETSIVVTVPFQEYAQPLTWEQIFNANNN